MRILFVISIMALIALLWATVATAQHVRRARRRKRRFLESTSFEPETTRGTLGLSNHATSVPQLTFLDPSAPLPEPAPPAIEEVLTETEAATSEPEIAVAEEHLEAPTTPLPFVENNPAPETEITVAAEEQLEVEEPPALAEILEAHHPEPEQEAAPEPPAPPPPRVVHSSHARHPLASLIPPIERPDWAYFNKDMGDLSDPAPRAPRIDSKIRPAFKLPTDIPAGKPADPNLK